MAVPIFRLDSLPAANLSDLHVHTSRSDALVRPADAVARARELGIRIAVTDHDVVAGALEAWEAAGDEGFDRVVPGIEVTTRERVHLLVYFRDPDALARFHEAVIAPNRPGHDVATLPASISLVELLAEASTRDCITSAAHPYAAVFNGVMTARRKHGLDESQLEQLTAVEVVNGSESDVHNRRAARLARRLGKAATAGSDAHVLSQIGSVCVATPTGDDLFVALRRGHAVVFNRPQWRLLNLLSHSAKLPFHASRPWWRLRWLAAELRKNR